MIKEPAKVPTLIRDIEAIATLNEEVYVRDLAVFKAKFAKLRASRHEELAFISDFDSTLTKKFIDITGKTRSHNSWGVIENSALLPEDFRIEILKRLDHYLPITLDKTKLEEEREKAMKEWFDGDQKSLIDLKISKELFRACLLNSLLYLRNGITSLLQTVAKYRLRSFIVSAGIKSIIVEALNILYAQKSLPNIKEILTICATGEAFDSNGVLVGFTQPLVTMSNKNTILTSERYPQIKGCRNAIIMGDAVEDLLAASALNLDCTISVGFDNFADAKLSEEMAASYDIVIKGDGNLHVVTEIIEYIKNDDYRIKHEGLAKLLAS